MCHGGQRHFLNLTEGHLEFGLRWRTINKLTTDSVVHSNAISLVPHRFEWQNLIYCNLDIVSTSLTQIPLPNNLLPFLPLYLLPNVHIPRAQKCWVLLFALHTDFFCWACKLSPNICSRESCKAEEKPGSETHMYTLIPSSRLHLLLCAAIDAKQVSLYFRMQRKRKNVVIKR